MSQLLNDIFVILVKPKFPENVGMASRACANMGCPNLVLIQPSTMDMGKAFKLATHQGGDILENLQIFDCLREATASLQRVYATTARLGGWRRAWISPDQLGKALGETSDQGIATGLMFGPEDRGLNNEELEYAEELVHIPTADNATSLNLAQSVLITLYEIRQKRLKKSAVKDSAETCHIKLEDQLRLEDSLKTALLALDCLHGQNPEYFFRQWRHMLRRFRLKEHEYSAFMGLCRQIHYRIKAQAPERPFSDD